MREMWEALSIADRIQTSIALATFFAVLVALFGERLWRWIDRPKIYLTFDRASDRCFRWADVALDNVQDEERHLNVKRQYFRLKVENKGGIAKNLRIRVDILKGNKELERFEPSTLLWISGREREDLANGESEYTNFISQVLHSPTKIDNRLRIEIFNAKERGIAWDRPLDQYNYKIIVYGDNLTPKIFLAKFTPNRNINTPGKLTVKKDC